MKILNYMQYKKINIWNHANIVKTFVASNQKAEYDTFNCKNHVYNFSYGNYLKYSIRTILDKKGIPNLNIEFYEVY